MDNQIKIGIAAIVLVGMGGAVYKSQQDEKAENARLAAGTGAGAGALPDVKLAADDVEKITKIQIKNADKPEVVLEKDGDKWRVKKPVDYLANQSNVKALLDNMKELKTKELVDKATSSYADYGVDDGKAVHVEAFKGGDKAVDLYFGKSGGRGQMARKGGAEGVFAISGYSSYVYAREVKAWRDTALLKFEDTAVTKVDIKNENGAFSFAKEGEAWTAKLAKDDKKPEAIERFDDSKLKDMLRAYKGLSADDFGDDKSEADAGLDKPAASVVITLKEGEPIKLAIGKTSSGENRYLKKEGEKQIFSVSSWAAGWAVAKVDKFQKAEEKKADDKDDKDDKKKDDKKDDKKKDEKKKDEKKK